MTDQILKSQIDQSVNFVEQQLIGFLESRYVRKTDEYFIAYLSSQTGCNKGCKFCHLTATHQVSYTDSNYQDFINQAMQVFRHYKKEKPAKYMHYNFMARGEPLDNQLILTRADDLLMGLAKLATEEKLTPKFNISTIMPQNLNSLTDLFKVVTPTIYYSLYSTNENFRKKWMPFAMEPEKAFKLLKDYQDMSKKIVKIHYAFIKDENDSILDSEQVCNMIKDHKLLCEFNLVRYNPFSPEQGEESPQANINWNIEYLKTRFPGKVQIIPRVGPDVKASCGMFV